MNPASPKMASNPHSPLPDPMASIPVPDRSAAKWKDLVYYRVYVSEQETARHGNQQSLDKLGMTVRL